MKIEFLIIIADPEVKALIQIRIFDSFRNSRVVDCRFVPNCRFQEAKFLSEFLAQPIPRRAKDFHLEGPSRHDILLTYNNNNK